MKVFDSYEVADAMADLLDEFLPSPAWASTRTMGGGWTVVVNSGTGAPDMPIDDVAETIREYMK